MNNKIIDYQSKIKDAEFEVESLQGTLAVKNQRLVEEEVELKWLNVREQILMSQKQNMDQERKKVSQDVVSLRCLFSNQFLDLTATFARFYRISPINFSGPSQDLEFHGRFERDVPTFPKNSNLLCFTQITN